MDFNTKNENEKNYIDSPILLNELDLFKQELDILLNSDYGEVYCDNKSASTVTDMLWKHKVSELQLKRELYNKISTECLMSEYFEYDIEVKFMQGEFRDIAVININIGDDEGIKFLYN